MLFEGIRDAVMDSSLQLLRDHFGRMKIVIYPVDLGHGRLGRRSTFIQVGEIEYPLLEKGEKPYVRKIEQYSVLD